MNEIQTYKLLQTLIDINNNYTITNEEKGWLKELILQRGWVVFLKLVEREFAKEYDRLRFKGGKVRNDFSYGRICGYLDGLEKCKKIVDIEIESHNPEE